MGNEHLTYPRENVRYLQWYEGHFSAVFVAFHPFFVLPGVRPDECDWGTFIVDNRGAIDAPTLDDLEDLRAAERDGLIAATDIEALIPSRARPMSWIDTCRNAGMRSHQHLNQALRTHIRGLKRKFEDRPAADRLEQFSAEKGVFLPTEGEFQVLHREGLASLARQLGVSQVVASDDVTEEVRVIEVSHLTRPWEWWPKRLWTPDESMLAVVDSDSFFTLICLSDAAMRTIDMPPFEGFWADATTEHDWWLHPLPGTA